MRMVCKKQVARALLRVAAFVRPVVASRYFGLFGAPMSVYYWLRYKLASKEKRADMRNIIDWYARIEAYDELLYFFNTAYKYAGDQAMGFIEHDNSIWEFAYRFGDCDDVARLAAKKLKALDYETMLVTVMKNFSPKTLHVECLFRHPLIKEWYAFNYGKPVNGRFKSDAIKALCAAWYAREENEAKTVVFVPL